MSDERFQADVPALVRRLSEVSREAGELRGVLDAIQSRALLDSGHPDKVLHDIAAMARDALQRSGDAGTEQPKRRLTGRLPEEGQPR